MTRFLGVPILRKEDPALLSGAGRYADDLPVPAGTLHAHVIRSPHAHAKIVGIDATEVATVLLKQRDEVLLGMAGLHS